MAKVIKADDLDLALAKILTSPKQPDEFSVKDFWQRSVDGGHKQTIASIRSVLYRAVQDGVLTTRRGTEGGQTVAFFKLTKQSQP